MAREEAVERLEFPNERWLAVIPVSLSLAVACLLVFTGLAEGVLAQSIQRFDQGIRSAIHQLASPQLTAGMRAITNLGDWQVILSATLLLLLFFCYRGAADYVRLLLVTIVGAGILDGVLKLVSTAPAPIPSSRPSPTATRFPVVMRWSRCAFTDCWAE